MQAQFHLRGAGMAASQQPCGCDRLVPLRVHQQEAAGLSVIEEIIAAQVLHLPQMGWGGTELQLQQQGGVAAVQGLELQLWGQCVAGE